MRTNLMPQDPSQKCRGWSLPAIGATYEFYSVCVSLPFPSLSFLPHHRTVSELDDLFNTSPPKHPCPPSSGSVLLISHSGGRHLDQYWGIRHPLFFSSLPSPHYPGQLHLSHLSLFGLPR